MKYLLIVLTAGVMVTTGCKKAANKPVTDSSEWKYFVAHEDFIVELPANWKFERLDGMDSYTGLFTNEKDSIEFDYGWYSGRFHGDSSKVLLTKEVIDHRNAVVATGLTAPYYRGLFIDSVNGSGFSKNSLSMYQVSQQEMATEKITRIFQSIKFN